VGTSLKNLTGKQNKRKPTTPRKGKELRNGGDAREGSGRVSGEIPFWHRKELGVWGGDGSGQAGQGDGGGETGEQIAWPKERRELMAPG